MSDTKVIGQYDAAISIDGAAHYMLIQQGNASAVYAKINRNTLLGVSGQPVDISSTQTLSAKTLDNTSTLTIKDSLFTVQNSSDTSKQAKLSLSGLTASTTRTYTLPDRSSTIATLGGDQTFTGANSFTGSAWSGGTIDNATVTVNTIAGHTTSNTGSIYGITVTTGVLSTANSIAAGTIVQNGVAAAQLATSAITLGYAQITSNSTATSASAVAGTTPITVTVTIPAGGRKVKITAYTGSLSIANNSTACLMSIWDGTVGSGTQLQQAEVTSVATGEGYSVIAIVVVTPAAGSKTYNVGITSDGTHTTTLSAGATEPAFILVEAI